MSSKMKSDKNFFKFHKKRLHRSEILFVVLTFTFHILHLSSKYKTSKNFSYMTTDNFEALHDMLLICQAK